MPSVRDTTPGFIKRQCPACREVYTLARIRTARPLCCQTCLLDTGKRIDLKRIKGRKCHAR